MTPTEVLEKLYATARDDEALDLLFEYGDETFSRGDFESYDQLLRDVDFDRVRTSTVIYGFLVPALWPKQQQTEERVEAVELPHRKEAGLRARSRLIALGKTVEEVDVLLRGVLA